MMSKKTNKTIYVHEIITIWSENGEVMIQTCNDDIIVFNGENLFKDIPTLMNLSFKERRGMEQITTESIESGLEDLKKELIFRS